MTWFVYLLLCDKKTYYVGITNNIDDRYEEHLRGYPSHTRKFFDIKLVYTEQYPTRHHAEVREAQLKKWSVAKKKALIAGNIELLKSLSKGLKIVDTTAG